MKPISFFIGLVVYALFLLGKSKKDSAEEPPHYLCFIIALILSILLYYVHLLGVSLGGFIGGFIGTVLSINDTFSYIISGILGFLFAAYGIKVLPSKVHSITFHYFKVISFLLYFLLGLYMLFMPFLYESTSLRSPGFIILGISYIGVSLYVVFIHPTFTKPNTSQGIPSKSKKLKINLTTLVDSGVNSTDEKTSLPKETPAVSSVPVALPVVSAAPVEKALPEATASQGISTSLLKRSKHSFAMWVVFLSVFFCLLGVALGYLAGGGYLSEDLVPNSPYIQKLKKAESDAASKGYKKGYHDGRDDGYVAGKEYGYREGYSDGYDEGASDELALLLDDYLG